MPAVHALPTPPGPFAVDLAQLGALSEVIEHRVGLPRLITRWFGEDGLHVQPYIPTRPLTALWTWLEGLEAETDYKATLTAVPAPGGLGTQVTARGELAGAALTLTVTTWRAVVADRAADALTRGALHDAMNAETRDDGQPHDPLTLPGKVAPPESASSLTGPPSVG